MPDWKRQVRRHLKLPPLANQRAERIVEELAGQLEDLYAQARRQGASSSEATRAAFAQVENWDELSEQIAEAERPNRVSAAEQRFEDALGQTPRGGATGRLVAGITMDARIGLRRARTARRLADTDTSERPFKRPRKPPHGANGQTRCDRSAAWAGARPVSTGSCTVPSGP